MYNLTYLMRCPEWQTAVPVEIEIFPILQYYLSY